MSKNLAKYTPWALLLALCAPMLISLYRNRWEFVDYTHAYFILPVSLWLVWRMRKNLATLATPAQNSGSPLALTTLILGLLLFIFSYRLDYLSLQTISLIPLLFGMSSFLYGNKVARALRFPILYLLLMVPPPLGVLDALTIPMRKWVTILSVNILSALQYPITRDGLSIYIGGHEIYMGPACSGFRSLITMISLGLLYVYLISASRKTKALLLASVIPLALLGNLIRVLGVCLVMYHFGEKAGTTFHDVSGYGIFFILIFGMLGLENLFKKCLKETL